MRTYHVKACHNEFIDGVEYMVDEDGKIYMKKRDDARPSSAKFLCYKAKRTIDTQLNRYLTI